MKVILAMNNTSKFQAITFETQGTVLQKVACNQSFLRAQGLNLVSFNAAFMGIANHSDQAVPVMGTVNVDRDEFWVTVFNDDSQVDDESETVNNLDLVQANALGVDVLVLSGQDQSLDEFAAGKESIAGEFFDANDQPMKIGLRSFWAPGVSVLESDQVTFLTQEFPFMREGR